MNQDIDIYTIVNKLREYELSLSAIRDIKNGLDAAWAEGIGKG